MGDFVDTCGEGYNAECYTVLHKLKYVLHALQLFETADEFNNDELSDFYF